MQNKGTLNLPLRGTYRCHRGRAARGGWCAMETYGEGLANLFVKLNGKENAAHAPGKGGGKGGKKKNWE